MTFFSPVKCNKLSVQGTTAIFFIFFTFVFTCALPQLTSAASEDENRDVTSLEIVIGEPESGISAVGLAADPLPWKGRDDKGIRSRKITINPEAQKRKRRSSTERLSLQLFDDTLINAEVAQSLIDINGTTITTAKIPGTTWGRVFMASTNGRLRVKVHNPESGKFYAIQFNDVDGEYYALELDPEKVQYDGSGIPTPEDAMNNENTWDLPEIMDDPSAASNTVVDVMVVYSNDALSDAGGQAGVNNVIASGMAYGNDAHSNSNTGIYLNLVHSQLINYNGTNNRTQDLYNVTNTDGIIDEVHTLRDDYGADFVVLLVGNYSSDGGVAWVLQSTNGSASYAFSVVTEPAFDSYTTVHEIGHNMGLSHAKDQNFQAGPTNWYRDDYGFGNTTAGWHWHPTPNSKGYCSIMTYTGGSYFPDGLSHWRVGYFSDPNISYNGYPTGHASDGDSARVLRAMKNVYASYRDRPAPPATLTVTYPNGGESLTADSNSNIQWNSSNLSGNVKIDLYQNSTFDRIISSGTANDGIFNWSIPGSLTGSNFTIRISDLPDTVADESNSGFNIAGVPANAPEVATLTADSITLDSVNLNGSITDLGAPNPHAHGFIWSMDANPDLSDNVIDLGSSSSTGGFFYSLSGLESATTYYIRAFATNSSGTGYGDIIQMKTLKEDMTCFPVRTPSGRISITCF